MIMKTIYKIVMMAGVLLAATGCYEDFDMPEPIVRYETDEEFEAAFARDPYCECLQKITIKEVKDAFIRFHGSLSNTGNNSGWSNTKTVKFGELNPAEASTRAAGEEIAAWHEAANYYIKGKVLSDDTQGNVYKSLYLYDGTAAIEIKLTNGLYLNYPQGSWVYVRLRDLYLGNYRMMLSIGNGPTASYNAMQEPKYYANSNIEDPRQIKEHIFLGKKDQLQPSDYIVVNKDNYTTMLGEEAFGRLVRFEGLTCYYAGVMNQNGDTNRELMNGTYQQIYPSWIDTNTRNPVVSKPWYKWAFSYNGVSLYGSVCFTYLSHDELNSKAYYTSHPGIYIVRSSGYSRFAGRPVPRDGAEATITAIYCIYSQRSDYSGGANDYATYQLTVNSFEDMVFTLGEGALLSDGTKDTNRDGKIDEHDDNDVLRMTPNGYTYDEESGKYIYDPSNDSYYVPSKESSDRTTE